MHEKNSFKLGGNINYEMYWLNIGFQRSKVKATTEPNIGKNSAMEPLIHKNCSMEKPYCSSDKQFLKIQV